MALADAEGFLPLIQAVEEVGAYLTNGQGRPTLAGYSPALVALASQATADTTLFPSLLDALREARNDAAHLGASARRISVQATDVAVILEDALMNHAKLKLVEHYMVDGPICAEEWQTVSMVRATMLRSQFSALPYRKGSKWYLLTDAAIVRFLAEERSTRLHLTVGDAIANEPKLHLELAQCEVLGSFLEPLRAGTHLRPVLVVDEKSNLHGILTPFDLL